MIRNILEYLEVTGKRVPDKTAFFSDAEALTFAQLEAGAKAIGSGLLHRNLGGKPVAVLMGRQPRTIAAFLGVLYAGGFYIPLDREMPEYRIRQILDTVHPVACICDGQTRDLALGVCGEETVLEYACLLEYPIREEELKAVRENQVDTDPAYVVFTSGSTGTPKGVVGCHRGVIDYIENLCGVLSFDETTVFGNQSPLYFDACLKEIIPTLKYGATTCFLPRKLFVLPVAMVEYLNEKRINTLCWVVSALTYITSFRTFDTVKPRYLRTVAFASEAFPPGHLNRWRHALPDTEFVNLYGPTEATGICCWYRVERDLGDEEILPAGRPLPNTRILLLDGENRAPAPGETGEICVLGSRLTLGYYGDEEKTERVFTRNPLNPFYPERIYRTGDMGRLDESGNLIFLGRKDNQIKLMGHRIELEEIEAAACALEGVSAACCVFLPEKKKLILYYTGRAEPENLRNAFREKLPRYMIPHRLIRLERMPRTPNGKTDRNLLKKRSEENG